MTRLAEVIGHPIAQSKSPAIHTYWIGRAGIDATYGRQHVTAGELDDYMARRARDSSWAGCNVTMPHKLGVMPLCDMLDPLAQRIGAVDLRAKIPRHGRVPALLVILVVVGQIVDRHLVEVDPVGSQQHRRPQQAPVV